MVELVWNNYCTKDSVQFLFRDNFIHVLEIVIIYPVLNTFFYRWIFLNVQQLTFKLTWCDAVVVCLYFRAYIHLRFKPCPGNTCQQSGLSVWVSDLVLFVGSC